jgi:phage N-6-adenine-methyltransferase
MRARGISLAEHAAKIQGRPIGDFYRTPPEILAWTEARWGRIRLDAAALPAHGVCADVIAPWQDGLAVPWAARLAQTWGGNDGIIWCNPPYSTERGGLLAWVRAALRASEEGARSVLLVPPSMGSRYMVEALAGATEIVVVTPRISFLDPITGQRMKGNRGDSCLIYFGGSAPAAVSTVEILT